MHDAKAQFGEVGLLYEREKESGMVYKGKEKDLKLESKRIKPEINRKFISCRYGLCLNENNSFLFATCQLKKAILFQTGQILRFSYSLGNVLPSGMTFLSLNKRRFHIYLFAIFWVSSHRIRI